MNAKETTAPQLKINVRLGEPWGQRRQLEFVELHLQYDGYLNQVDLVEHYGISVRLTSLYIANDIDFALNTSAYGRSERVYVVARDSQPAYSYSPSTKSFLPKLLAQKSVYLAPKDSVNAWATSLAVSGTPARTVDAKILVTAVRSVRARETNKIFHQSVCRTGPTLPKIYPRLLKHEGF